MASVPAWPQLVAAGLWLRAAHGGGRVCRPERPEPAKPITPEILRLQRRPEFTRAAAHGSRWHAPFFQLQAVPRPEEGAAPVIGVGFTATKRLGGAVERNRAKRRLREASRLVLPSSAEAGCNYVLIAKPAVLTCTFSDLLSELERAFKAIRRKRAGREK
jgi:ribonuclease P protein component